MKSSREQWAATALIAAVVLLGFSQAARSDIVYVWSEDGTIRKFDANGSGSLFASGDLEAWNGPVGLALDNVGNLYAGVPSNSTIFKYAPDGNRTVFGCVDSVSGMAFDLTGSLHVTIPGFSSLYKPGFTLSVGYGHPASELAYTQSHLGYAVALAFDNSGAVYVSCGSDYYPQQYDNTVQKFSTNYTYIGCVTNYLSGGAGIAFDAADNLYVSNSGSSGSLSNTVLKITPSGVGSKYLVQSNGIRRPKGLAFDSATNLYVASSGNGTIYKFSPTKVRTVFATGLSTPTSIAIYPGLNLWSTKPISWVNAGATTNHSFQSEFHNNPGLTMLVRATTNLSQDAASWDTLSNVVERAPGVYQFTDPCATNAGRRFFRVQAP